jgi:hypothetical protein
MTVAAFSGSDVVDYGDAPRTPPRVGIVHGDGVWLDSPIGVERVRASDLRGLARRTAAVRAALPGTAVLADMVVMISPDAHSARAALSATSTDYTTDTLLYVGTPTGLAGLIVDIWTLGIADGAVLIPAGSGQVLHLIHDEVLPHLRTLVAQASAVRDTKTH